MAETTKKTKAPAKPRAASTKKAASGEQAASPVAKTAPAAKVMPRRPSHEEIARLAEQYWAERGHAEGAAEQDWLRAEQELMKMAS